jgi:hypothetical protein
MDEYICYTGSWDGFAHVQQNGIVYFSGAMIEEMSKITWKNGRRKEASQFGRKQLF